MYPQLEPILSSFLYDGHRVLKLRLMMPEAPNSSKPKSKIAFAVIRMPDGTEHEIPLPPKTFSSGREGYYAQIPAFVYEDEVYGGQIQVWKKGEKKGQKV